MYIKKVKLTNVRCFKNLEFDLSSESGVQKWGLILGDNGYGKTTIIRSIAMGLCDSTGAASLLQDTYGDWVRWGEKEAKIEIDLLDGDMKHSIKTIIHSENGSKLETIKQQRKDDFPWEKIFVCGYGANRSISGSEVYEKYSLADALATLFWYDYELQNPELMLRRRALSEGEVNEVCKWLDEILMLKEGTVKLDERGIKMNDLLDQDVYLGSLPDGRVSMITVVLDFLGWATLKGLKGQKNKLSGIILLDEVEQHLHPSWQKYIIKNLHNVFPNLQFIGSTHSPLCAIGTANLPNADEVCSLLALHQDGDHVEGRDKINPPRGERADQVLTSFLFGLDSSRSDDTQQRIEKYSKILSKASLTKNDKIEVAKLEAELNEELGSAETPLQELVEKAVRKALDDLVSQNSEGKESPPKAINFEVKRQLKELLD